MGKETWGAKKERREDREGREGEGGEGGGGMGGGGKRREEGGEGEEEPFSKLNTGSSSGHCTARLKTGLQHYMLP